MTHCGKIGQGRLVAMMSAIRFQSVYIVEFHFDYIQLSSSFYYISDEFTSTYSTITKL
jgi:hypothetical protein